MTHPIQASSDLACKASRRRMSIAPRRNSAITTQLVCILAQPTSAANSRTRSFARWPLRNSDRTFVSRRKLTDPRREFSSSPDRGGSARSPQRRHQTRVPKHPARSSRPLQEMGLCAHRLPLAARPASVSLWFFCGVAQMLSVAATLRPHRAQSLRPASCCAIGVVFCAPLELCL